MGSTQWQRNENNHFRVASLLFPLNGRRDFLRLENRPLVNRYDDLLVSAGQNSFQDIFLARPKQNRKDDLT